MKPVETIGLIRVNPAMMATSTPAMVVIPNVGLRSAVMDGLMPVKPVMTATIMPAMIAPTHASRRAAVMAFCASWVRLVTTPTMFKPMAA